MVWIQKAYKQTPDKQTGKIVTHIRRKQFKNTNKNKMKTATQNKDLGSARENLQA